MARRRIKKRAFEGQREAERLAKWINQDLYAPDRRRIIRLIWDIRDFLTVTESARAKGLLRAAAWFRHPAAVEEIQEYAKELQEQLRRYWSATHLELWPRAADHAGISFQIAWRDGSKVSREETVAFLDVLTLTREQNIHRLRECDTCPRWMFVKFPNGDRSEKQCSKPCIREARTYYMRDYQRKRRQEEKKADEQAKAAVGYRRN